MTLTTATVKHLKNRQCIQVVEVARGAISNQFPKIFPPSFVTSILPHPSPINSLLTYTSLLLLLIFQTAFFPSKFWFVSHPKSSFTFFLYVHTNLYLLYSMFYTELLAFYSSLLKTVNNDKVLQNYIKPDQVLSWKNFL